MRVPHQGSLGVKNSRLVLWETALEKSQRREAGGWCGPAMEGPGSPGDGGSLDPPPKPSAPHRCPKPRGCAEVGCSPPAVSSWKRSSGICLGWERGFQTAGAGKTPRGGPSLASAVFQLVTAKNVTARPLSQKKTTAGATYIPSAAGQRLFPYGFLGFWHRGWPSAPMLGCTAMGRRHLLYSHGHGAAAPRCGVHGERVRLPAPCWAPRHRPALCALQPAWELGCGAKLGEQPTH